MTTTLDTSRLSWKTRFRMVDSMSGMKTAGGSRRHVATAQARVSSYPVAGRRASTRSQRWHSAIAQRGRLGTVCVLPQSAHVIVTSVAECKRNSRVEFALTNEIGKCVRRQCRETPCPDGRGSAVLLLIRRKDVEHAPSGVTQSAEVAVVECQDVGALVTLSQNNDRCVRETDFEVTVLVHEQSGLFDIALVEGRQLVDAAGHFIEQQEL